MTSAILWDEFHSAWRRIEASLRTQQGASSLRGPINEIIEANVRSHRLTPAAAAELDAFRRLRNLDSHEGLNGSGGHLCLPSAETVARVKDLADQLECPLAAVAVMERAVTCASTSTLGVVLAKLRDGADVVYYRDRGGWYAFDRTQMSRIVERNIKGATTTIDLQRSISDHASKVGPVSAPVIDLASTARRAASSLRAVMAAGDNTLYKSVLAVDGRTVWHLTADRLETLERRLAN